MPAGRGWCAACALVVVLATWVAFSGLGADLPLDSHEALVARGTEEMIARDSILVPYFNGQPRLKKPPLNYWLVMGIDAMGGTAGSISELEARLPSALAAVLLVAMTLALGTLAVDRNTGLLAGLIVAASSGFVSYSHSARPEMVYAMFCNAAMLCFIACWRMQCAAAGNGADTTLANGAAPVRKCFEQEVASIETVPLPHGRGSDDTAAPSRAALVRKRSALVQTLPWLGWAMLGGAMLTKGPQIPLVILAGLFIGLRAAGERGNVTRILRPWSGLLIFAVVSLWWYVAVIATVPNAVALWRDELGDHIAGPSTPWWSIFNPYYLYRTAGLVAPWVILYPLALALPLIKPAWMREGNRLLWWILITAMVGMSLSMGRRWYYLLPMLAPLAVLMAGGGLAIGRALWAGAVRAPARIIIALHAVAIVGAMLWMWRTEPGGLQPPVWGVALCVAAGIAAMTIAMMRRGWGTSAPRDALAGVLVAGGVFFAVAADNASLWGGRRQAYRDFSHRVSQIVAPSDRIVGWEDSWAMTQYYIDRAIPEIDRSAKLRDAVDESGPTWVLVNAEEPIKLPKHVDGELLLSMACDGRADGLQLWRVSPRERAGRSDNQALGELRGAAESTGQ